MTATHWKVGFGTGMGFKDILLRAHWRQTRLVAQPHKGREFPWSVPYRSDQYCPRAINITEAGISKQMFQGHEARDGIIKVIGYVNKP